MPIITTQNLPGNEANPKPVRRFNWCGQPMAEGDSYYGDIETAQNAPPESANAPRTRRKRRGGIMSADKRKAFGDRMRAYWAKKKALATQAIVTPSEE